MTAVAPRQSVPGVGEQFPASTSPFKRPCGEASRPAAPADLPAERAYPRRKRYRAAAVHFPAGGGKIVQDLRHQSVRLVAVVAVIGDTVQRIPAQRFGALPVFPENLHKRVEGDPFFLKYDFSDCEQAVRGVGNAADMRRKNVVYRPAFQIGEPPADAVFLEEGNHGAREDFFPAPLFRIF